MFFLHLLCLFKMCLQESCHVPSNASFRSFFSLLKRWALHPSNSFLQMLHLNSAGLSLRSWRCPQHHTGSPHRLLHSCSSLVAFTGSGLTKRSWGVNSGVHSHPGMERDDSFSCSFFSLCSHFRF